MFIRVPAGYERGSGVPLSFGSYLWDVFHVTSLVPDRIFCVYSCLCSSDTPEKSLVMPRRVFAPWVDGAMISDYILPDENLQVSSCFFSFFFNPLFVNIPTAFWNSDLRFGDEGSIGVA